MDKTRKYKSEFLKTLHERGFIQDCTDSDGLDDLLVSEKPIPAYIGFDCTAPSLHVGSLLQIMTLRHLQKSGHKPIILMGGGTTKVGDPSGKDESRKLLTDEDIKNNMEGIKEVFSKFVKFEEKFDPKTTNAIMVNNDDWLKKLNYIEFLRDYGRHFSVNRMLSMDSVKLRIEREQHLSFLEFNYMILQAYDFVVLNKEYGCRLQIGGSDQWGNIVNGTELQHKIGSKDKIFGLTTPLLTTSSGAKMGKTAQGAVWLNADMLKPYDYWQYWRNTEDADVRKFLLLFTDLDIAEIEKAVTGNINDAKKLLASEATKLCHGLDAAKDAEETARKIFEEGGIGEGVATIEIAKNRLVEGIPAFQLFKEAGLAESGSDARRLIKGGGAKINDEKVNAEDEKVSITSSKDGIIKLSAGKKRHAVVKVV